MDSTDRSGYLAFDASQFPDNERMSAFDAFARRGPGKHFSEALFQSNSADNPNYNKAERFLADSFWLSRCETSGHRVIADEGMASDTKAALMFVFVKTGSMEVMTRKEGIDLGPGDVYLRSFSEAPVQATFGAGEIYRMVFPKSQFGNLETNRGEPMVLRASGSIAGIVRSTIVGLEHDLRNEGSTNRRLLSRIARDLVYNIATNTASSVDQSHYEFLLERGRAYINNHLHEPDLDANAIATHLGVSRATLYRVFEPQGGVRSCITTLRLDAARRMLMSVPMQRGLISNVAYSCGFTSPELFSRAFKAGFGISPSEFSERNFGT